MARACTVFAAIAVLLCTTTARASDPEPEWTARFVRGTSPGEPSSAKLATVLSLYGAGITSLAGGIVLTVEGMSTGASADELARSNPDGFCNDRGDPTCTEYLELRRDESDQLLFGQALFGASAAFVLSGALTAELWSNQPLSVSAGTRGVALGFTADF